jgi:hypothetical protein
MEEACGHCGANLPLKNDRQQKMGLAIYLPEFGEAVAFDYSPIPQEFVNGSVIKFLTLKR